MDLLSFRLLFNHTKSAYNMVLAIPSNLRLFFLHAIAIAWRLVSPIVCGYAGDTDLVVQDEASPTQRENELSISI